MILSITEKQQGDGTTSWTIEYDDKVPEIVFKYPSTVEVLNEKILYDKRKEDGINAYLMLAAEFRVSSNPREVVKLIEDKLELVRNEIINGQWITAREKLEEVAISAEFTQEIYDRLHLSLTTYITENY